MKEQVSGPGKNAKRTDLNVSKQPVRYMAGGSYGEGQELMGLQEGAPLSNAPTVNMIGGGRGGRSKPISASMPITPLTAMTQRPNEPLSAGSDFGAGPGSEVLNLPPAQNKKTLIQNVQELLKDDVTGEISAIFNFLNNTNRGL